MLYEVITILVRQADLGISEKVNGVEITRFVGNVLLSDAIAEATRITSYNVCYTKLLRSL